MQQAMPTKSQIADLIAKDGVFIAANIIDGEVPPGMQAVTSSFVYSVGEGDKDLNDFLIFVGFAHRAPRQTDPKVHARLSEAGQLIKTIIADRERYKLKAGDQICLNSECLLFDVIDVPEEVHDHYRRTCALFGIYYGDKKPELKILVPHLEMMKTEHGRNLAKTYGIS